MTNKAKTYGSSLYDLAIEEGLVEEFFSDLQLVRACFDEIPEYRKLISSPAIPKDERKGLLKEAWEGKVHPYTLNFLYILCDNDMFSDLTDCEKEYHQRYNKDKGIIAVNAYVAMPLGEETKAKLLAAIEKKTGKKVELNVVLDEKLIGGMRLEMEGKAMDGSISYHLDALKQLLAGNVN